MSLLQASQRVLLGARRGSSHEAHEQNSVLEGLSVGAPDPTTSMLYVFDEIYGSLVLVGFSSLWVAWPITIIISVLFLVLVGGYFLVIKHFPNGGGAYAVGVKMVGVGAGLVAAASLLWDYILTIALSVSAGVFQIVSAFPFLAPFTVLMCVAIILGLWIFNLRSLHGIAKWFQYPFAVFIILTLGTLVLGVVKHFSGTLPEMHTLAEVKALFPDKSLPIWLMIVGYVRAFASGCILFTGVEGLSNETPTFEPGGDPPASWKTTDKALVLLALIIIVILPLIGAVSLWIRALPGDESVVSQIARAVFTNHIGGILGFILYLPYYADQFVWSLMLIMAAQTSLTSAPLLMKLLATEGWFARYFKDKPYSLTHGYGVSFMAIGSLILTVAFNGNTSRLAPLYSLGVFVGFSICLFGMVRFFLDMKKRGISHPEFTKWWPLCLSIVGFAFCTMSLCLLILILMKWEQGAWIAILGILCLVPILNRFGFHNIDADSELRICSPVIRPKRRQIHYMIFGEKVDRRLVKALNLAIGMRNGSQQTIEVINVEMNYSDVVTLSRSSQICSIKTGEVGKLQSNGHNDVDLPALTEEEIASSESYLHLNPVGTPFVRAWDAFMHDYSDIWLSVIYNDTRDFVSAAEAYVNDATKQCTFDEVVVILPATGYQSILALLFHHGNARKLSRRLRKNRKVHVLTPIVVTDRSFARFYQRWLGYIVPAWSPEVGRPKDEQSVTVTALVDSVLPDMSEANVSE